MKDKLDLSEIKILAETPHYPAWVFSHKDTLNSKIVKTIEQALLEIPESLFKEVELPGKPTGFVETTDAELDSIRNVADKVKIEY